MNNKREAQRVIENLQFRAMLGWLSAWDKVHLKVVAYPQRMTEVNRDIIFKFMEEKLRKRKNNIKF